MFEGNIHGEGRMRGKELLELQVQGSFGLIRERLEKVSGDDWTTRAIPGTSLVGFTLWHAARTIDWAVHCAIQGVTEVADRPEWDVLCARQYAYGAGISDEEADLVALSVTAEQVRAYLDALQPAVLGWLRERDDSELDHVPEVEAHQRGNPRYLEPAVWAEVNDLAGRPAWQILARPCVSHIRVHAGQVDILLQASSVGTITLSGG
jgi:hypothetical protein